VAARVTIRHMTRGSLLRPRAWLVALAMSVATYLAYRALRRLEPADILHALDAIGMRHVILTLAFTAASFVCLACSDALAVRYAGRNVPLRRVALASFTSVAIGHTLGLAFLSSGALRYRFYTAWGLSQGDVGRVLLFCGMTVTLGIATAAAVATLAKPALVAEMFFVSPRTAVGAALGLLCTVGAYLAVAGCVRQPLRLRRIEVPVPGFALAIGQVAIGATDQFVVAAALYHMLSASSDVGYVAVAAAYATANAAAIAAHVPGGLGVIEAVVSSLLPGGRVLGGVLAFRALYFVVPFFLGCATFAAAELYRRR
jgi:uncharacterized membrane protein YbhN (UPF0104 family)